MTDAKELAERIEKKIAGIGPGYTVSLGIKPGEWRLILDGLSALRRVAALERGEGDLKEEISFIDRVIFSHSTPQTHEERCWQSIKDALAALRVERGKLREALKPFAKFSSGFGRSARDDSWVITKDQPGGSKLTMGDVRAAEDTLTHPDSEKGEG